MMAWWKRVDDPVPFYPVEQEDGWADVAASMKADIALREVERMARTTHRTAHRAAYLHCLGVATDALDAKKYLVATAYSTLAQLHLTAWQHGAPYAPAPQTAAAPAADHEKHTQQEQT